MNDKLHPSETIGEYFNRQIKKSEKLQIIWLKNKEAELEKYPNARLDDLLRIINKIKKRRDEIDVQADRKRIVGSDR